MKSTIFAVLFVISVTIQNAYSLKPRGVRPDMGGFYDPNSMFHCLDGSDSITFDMVNDDYCDCKDGSDEPGTSACSNGSFYCPNRGFKPSNLASSRVNDGICDCCDGSDEWAMVGGSPCSNNCDEMGAADKAERVRLEKIVEEGLRVKAEMESQGSQLKHEREKQIYEKRAELDKLNQEKHAKQAIKDEAETHEKAALDVIREEEDRQRVLKEEEEKKEKEAEALEFFNKFDKNQDGILSRDELLTVHAFDQNNDGMVNEDEVNFYLSGNESYDQETFLNTGWLLMKNLFSKYEKRPAKNNNAPENPVANTECFIWNEKSWQGFPSPNPIATECGLHSCILCNSGVNAERNDENIPEANEDEDDGTAEDYDYDDLDDNDPDDSLEAPKTEEEDAKDEETQEEPPSSQYSPEVQALVDAANTARDDFRTAERACNDVDHDVQNLQKHLDKDYGVNEVFATLANNCFEYNDLEYTYKMCAFDYTAQKPLHGGSETRLGSWEKWSLPHTQMSYERGVQCWNGPARSTKVNIRCGAENKLVSAAEPNRCEYEFMFETPAVCEPLPPLNHDEL